MACILKITNTVAPQCLPLTAVTWDVIDATTTTLYTLTGLPTDVVSAPGTPFVGGTVNEPHFDFTVLTGEASPVTIRRTVDDSCGNTAIFSREFTADTVTSIFSCSECSETVTSMVLSGTSIVYTNESSISNSIDICNVITACTSGSTFNLVDVANIMGGANTTAVFSAANVNIQNGLHTSGLNVRLGGTLDTNTIVSQGSNHFSFATGGSSLTSLIVRGTSGIVGIPRTPVYADDAAAGAGGLVAGDVYQLPLVNAYAMAQGSLIIKQ